MFSLEIQGIRAISIMAVILFHFGIGSLPGGYAGVDMFFVISGFLIGGLIVREIEAGTFSFARFYRNRVIRLLPNLFLMIVVSAAISYVVLMPYDFIQYAKSLQFSAIYVTNIVFSRQQGYFDPTREAKPLLHTWSLSIEEQFYLVFPLLLILLFKLRQHRLLVLALMALVSLWVRYWYTVHNLPIEGFFSFAGRIWEFIVGAMAALAPARMKAALANKESWAVLAAALIAASLLWLGEGVPYSCMLLLVPCFATALLILSAPGTTVGKVLSNKAMVFIGGISYSLYLWHWPLLVGWHNAGWQLGTWLQPLVLITLTAIISIVAWKYVEEPFRRNRERFSGKRAGMMVASFAVVCAGAGSYIYANEGMEQRFPNWGKVKQNIAAFDFKAATGIQPAYPGACAIGPDPVASMASCTFGDRRAVRTVLVLGDSHAAAWYPAFQAALEKMHYRGILASLPGCPPVFGISSYDGAKNICAEGFDDNIGRLITTQKIDKIFLLGFWSLYSEGMPGNQPDHFISNANIHSHDAEASKAVLRQALRDTILRFREHGAEVILVRSVPALPKVVQSLPEDYALPMSAYLEQQRFMLDFIHEYQSRLGFHIVDPTAIFCPGDSCATRIHGNVLYTDNNHVSPAGAASLIGLIESELN